MKLDVQREQPVSTKGLEGIKAAASEICFIDGLEGRLLYRGYNIHELADHSSFEEVVHLLWDGELPSRRQLDATRKALAAERRLAQPVVDLIRSMPRGALPMDVLRTAVSLAGVYDPDAHLMTPEANRRKAVRLTAQVATIVAAFERCRSGAAPVDPDPSLGHAANFLYMLTGRRPSDLETRSMDLILLLHADHDFNASTFTARGICSTLADMHSAVTGAIGSLKGPLHGGAGVGVLDALEDVGDVSRVEDYIRNRLAHKEKIMGFGHRVYKVEDPRAMHLRDLGKLLAERSGDLKWYQMAIEMENVVKQELTINVNVDFYSAIVQRYLGVAKELFTCTFAASRIAGWTAHIMEQYANNRLIRPLSDYVGPAERPYVPLAERG